jgi:hypothetical protein
MKTVFIAMLLCLGACSVEPIEADDIASTEAEMKVIKTWKQCYDNCLLVYNAMVDTCYDTCKTGGGTTIPTGPNTNSGSCPNGQDDCLDYALDQVEDCITFCGVYFPSEQGPTDENF